MRPNDSWTFWGKVRRTCAALFYLVLLSIHLKDRDVPLPVDLVTWRVLPHTLGLYATEIRGSRLVYIKVSKIFHF